MSNYEFKRGDTRFLDLVVTNLSTGAAQNIAGATFWFTAKKSLTDTDANAFIKKDNAGTGGVTITDAAAGKVRVTISPADTLALTRNTALFWDVQAKDPAGNEYTIDAGIMLVTLDSTQRRS